MQKSCALMSGVQAFALPSFTFALTAPRIKPFICVKVEVIVENCALAAFRTPQERLLAGIATGETGVFGSEIGFRTAGAALMRVGVDFSGTRRRLFLVVLGPHQLVKKL